MATLKPPFEGIGMTSRRTRERLVRRLRREGIVNPLVLDAMRDVPRHIFVDEALASRAYEDIALPIGCGQTISQPYVVARMTQALLGDGAGPRSVLEIGTGCGYQAAVLARLVTRVYSVERLAALVFQARERLHALRVNNVRVRHGDGYEGWPEHAPFDAVLLTAAPTEVPTSLLQQLSAGGRLLAPIGSGRTQELKLYERTARGFDERSLEGVSFVPMVSGTG